MPALLPRRLMMVWLLLVAATLFSWDASHGRLDPRLATTTAIVIAFVKARLVIMEFMEIRAAPLALRLFCEAWVVLIGGALITITR